jgi:hypothetical protein
MVVVQSMIDPYGILYWPASTPSGMRRLILLDDLEAVAISIIFFICVEE